jgi:hypothetical protein
MAAYVELYMDQGATFNNIINISDDITNDNVNISGYIVTSQMRKSYYSQNASANIVCTVTNSVTGEVTMSLDAANTAKIPAGRYLFDVKTKNTSNVTTRILEGIITVTPAVTK